MTKRSASVVPLDSPVDADVVRALEEWLKTAKAGELRGIVLCGLGVDDCFWYWCGSWRLTEAIGCLEMAKAAMLRRNAEE